MIETVEKTILELFTLLKYEDGAKEKIVGDLVGRIQDEMIVEARDGLPKAKRDLVTDYGSACEYVDEDICMRILETASSRALVSYFSQNKKKYNKEQKEVFVAFLVTNKIKREFERLNQPTSA